MIAPVQMMDDNVCCVLIGDLVGSRSVSGDLVSATFESLRSATTRYQDEHGIELRFTRFRGDGWQLILEDPTRSLELSVYVIASLRAEGRCLPTRIAMGFGKVTQKGTDDLSDASGPAFEIAGHHLDRMPKKRRLAIAGLGIGMKEVAVFDLIECISMGWTASQANAVALMIIGGGATHEDIAKHLGVTRQAVQSRLASAGYDYLTNAVEAFREAKYF